MNSNINRKKLQRPLRGLCCSALLICITFAGASVIATDQPNADQLRFAGFENSDELISVNFEQVDIRIMLKTIGDITGINFVVDDSVKGNVTVMSPTKIRLGDIYKVLESVLEVKGFAAVQAGDLVKIVPKAKAVK
ncbi:MAG: hypothetical protein ACYST9_07065, partial [Planctomycetota bacterium]